MLLLLLSPVRTTSPPLSVHSGAEHETIMTVFVFSKKKGGGCCIAQSFSCCSRHSHQPKLVRAHLSSQRCAILQPPLFLCVCVGPLALSQQKNLFSLLYGYVCFYRAISVQFGFFSNIRRCFLLLYLFLRISIIPAQLLSSFQSKSFPFSASSTRLVVSSSFLGGWCLN